MKNIIKNYGFESGSLVPGWQMLPGKESLKGGVTTKRFYKGSYSMALAGDDGIEQVFELPVRATGDLVVYLSKELKGPRAEGEPRFFFEVLTEYFDGTSDLQHFESRDLGLSFQSWKKINITLSPNRLIRKVRFTVNGEEAEVENPSFFLILDSVVLPGHQLYSMNDVHWFGAIGDGRSHPLSERFKTLEEARDEFPGVEIEKLDQEIDQVAIQSALNSGYPVHLPAGTYLLGKRGLDLVGVSHLYGDGPGSTILNYWGENAALSVYSTGDEKTRDWSVERLSVFCKKMDSEERGTYGVQVGQLTTEAYNPARGGKLEDVQVSFASKAGLLLVASQNNLFLNLDLKQNQEYGCSVAAFKDTNIDNHFNNCTFRQNGRNGLFANGGAGFSYHGCSFNRNREEGVKLCRESENIARSWFFARCHFRSNNEDAGRRNEEFAQFLIEKQGKTEDVWHNIELRTCYFSGAGTGNWNIKGKYCQLLIWYPETERLAGEPITSKRKGYFSEAAIVNIWDDGKPEYWHLDESVRSASLNRTYAGNTEIYLAEKGAWKRVFHLGTNGILTTGQLEIEGRASSIVLVAENGKPYRLLVGNDGKLKTEPVKTTDPRKETQNA